MKSLKKIGLSIGLCLVLIAFNFSYFSNSGLLIYGLKNADKLTYKNAPLHKQLRKGYKSLSAFSMEQFFDAKASQEMASRVKDLQSKWETRNQAMSTLGTASYLDGGNTKHYESLASKSNPLLQEHFPDLLTSIQDYFQQRCPNSLVKFREGAALPGFHIFHCNKLFSLPVASVHKDMQWNRLRYSEEEDVDENNTLSFTLALELPEGGGGLYTFENIPEMPPVLNLIVPRPLLNSVSKKTKIEYKVGWMVTHNGQTYHMIAPCKPSKEYRITLQGHGIYEKNSNTWWLYW